MRHTAARVARLGMIVLLTCGALAPLPATAQAPPPPDPIRAVLDGDPATTERVDAADPVTAAVAISRLRFDAVGGGRAATHVVLSREDAFADSLAGAALTASAPLLLTASSALTPATEQEVRRVLAPGGRVVVLGGPAAVAPAVVDALTDAGYEVERLAGTTRVETAIAVADAVRAAQPGWQVLLARSDAPADNPTAAWADSVTAGAYAAAEGIPILVTPTAALHDAVAAWLAADATTEVILMGGEAALSDAVEAAVPGALRVAGAERTATAAEAAEFLWGAGGQGARRYVILDGGRADGWAYGLAAAGLAADAVAPPLLVVGGVTAATRRLVSECGDPAVDLLLVGDAQVIGEDVAGTLDGFDGSSCAGAAALRAFTDCTAALDYFREQGLAQVGPYGLDGFYWGGPEPVPAGGPVTASPEPVPAPGVEAPAEDGAAGGGDDDGGGVSGTNVQEEGVDEPDLVKTDGDTAWAIAGGALQVVDLTGTSPLLATTLELPPGFGHELLLVDDVLLVLSSGDGYAHPPGEPGPAVDFAPPYWFPEPLTTLTRYDVSAPLAPQRLDALEVDGAYRTARLVGGTARVVVSANPTGLEFVFPQDGSQEAHDEALAHNRDVVANAPLSAWLPNAHVDGGAEQPLLGCDDVSVPPDLSGLTTVTVLGVDVTTGVTPTSSAAVVAQGEVVYASPDRLVVSTSRWGVWNEVAPTDGVTTQLHSFAIDDPAATTYLASGAVDGYVLNQFALSEREGYLRVATTTQAPWLPDGTGGETDNGLTILAEGGGQLFEVGRLFGLGAGERIYAVRYLTGSLAAVVTFRQVDPLFLIDVSNPAAPTLVGELHVPGFSSYLHPVDDDHLLGVGQDATSQGQVTGLQVSLFDISDPAAPARADQVLFGPGWSEVEYDHRAFLYWAPAGLAVIPAQLYDPDVGTTFNGAVGLDVAPGSLAERGRVDHDTADEHRGTIRRSFVAGATLYTVSEAGLAAADLATLAPGGFAAFPPPPDTDPCCFVDPIAGGG